MDLTAVWYGRHPLSHFLLPLSWLYCAAVQTRRWLYRAGWLHQVRLPVPVIVVGNLTVGGTGKTPLVLRLAALLRECGWTPGIVTRGYGGQAAHWPQSVSPESDPAQVGDEAVLLARRSGCTVTAGPDRSAAGALALRLGGCDILLTDDGLQHDRLMRDLEIVLVDGERGFGNGRCLPAGPLREPPDRLTDRTNDRSPLVLYRDGIGTRPRMRLAASAAVNLCRPELTRPLAAFRGQRVCAVAGIGYPGRFFALLTDAGLTLDARPYPDHHRFTARDLAQWPESPVLMTEKDAVKCRAWSRDNHWYLPVDAVLDGSFLADFHSRLAAMTVRFRSGKIDVR